ncbi:MULTISPECIES: primosomal replication protein N [unclassified Neisseria]|uniref:primosomal replication protein N n=1 Tax=unclassified Neisseria TaxID=2623750 RepID=UPI0026663C96|nr:MULTISPECIES: primosomal replication protein N [unclassified Neisseria]MDO1509173.1 primosomal replication protein N [Neisseria sp. MVDL19-042950]MDO1515548.1 primosomal replication protein N [Neisseria sp. MVDL18-041461]MDO1562907.1 primosomal replication protein N [Neisseria sp. MVDL20-010259]
MNNLFILTAQIAECGNLRYTPAGIPVLDVTLKHESWQQENGQQCLVKFEMAAKIIGKDALKWQHRQNAVVEVSGFLAQKSQRYPKPVLRIQNIQEYKG